MFQYYPRSEDRYCEIKVLPGQPIISDNYGQLGSPYIEVIREIPKNVVERYKKFTLHLLRRQSILDNHKLPLIQELQKRYPELILCGSAAVFLHTGKVYSRNENCGIHDLDFVVPYYIKIEGDSEKELSLIYDTLEEFDESGVATAVEGKLKVSKTDKWGSGNDFDECIYVNNVPCDLAINPHQKFEYITFRGFRYKVATLASILEHKLKYANQGNGKHMQDIQDLINLPTTFKIK